MNLDMERATPPFFVFLLGPKSPSWLLSRARIWRVQFCFHFSFSSLLADLDSMSPSSPRVLGLCTGDAFLDAAEAASFSLRIAAAAIAAARAEGVTEASSAKRIGDRAAWVARTTLRRDSAGSFSKDPLVDSFPGLQPRDWLCHV